MPGTIRALIDSFTPGDQTPSANPMYGASWDDDNQQWVDPSGQALQDKHQKILNDATDAGSNVKDLTSNYYNTPSIATRVFHPKVAQQENALVSQWNAQGPTEQHQEDITQGINTGRVDTTRPYWGQPVAATPSGVLARMTQGNVTPQNISDVIRKQSDIGNGIEPAESGNLATALRMTGQQQNTLEAGGYPKAAANEMITGAGAGTEQNFNSKLSAIANRSNIMPSAKLAGGTIAGALGRQPQVEQAQDVDANNRLRSAVMQAGISKDDLAHFDQILAEHANGRRFATMKSFYSPAQEPGLYIGTDGKLGPSPLAGGLTSRMNASLNGGGSSAIPVGGGLNIIDTPAHSEGNAMPSRPLRAAAQVTQEEQATPTKGIIANSVQEQGAPSNPSSYLSSAIGSLFKHMQTDTSQYAHTSNGTVAMYSEKGKPSRAISKDEIDQYEQNPDGSLKQDKNGSAIPKQSQDSD